MLVRLSDGSTVEVPDEQVQDFLTSAPDSVVVAESSTPETVYEPPLEGEPSGKLPETPPPEQPPTPEIPTPIQPIITVGGEVTPIIQVDGVDSVKIDDKTVPVTELSDVVHSPFGDIPQKFFVAGKTQAELEKYVVTVTMPEIKPEISGKIDFGGLNLPSDYEYSNEPYDVLVKMAVEGKSIGELWKYINDNPDAIRGAYASRLADQIYAQLGAVGDLKGEEQFNAYKKLELIPKDAKYEKGEGGQWSYTVPSAQPQYTMPANFGLNETQLDYIRENLPEVYKVLNEQGLGDAFKQYGDRIIMAQYEANLQKDSPQLFTIYKNAGGGQAGINAINSEIVKQYISIEGETLTKGLMQLPDGKYINIDDLNDIRLQSPIVYDLLMSGGFDAYDKALADAIAKLKPFSSTERIRGREVDIEGKNGDVLYSTTYDIKSFIRENPQDVKTLKLVGFNDKDITTLRTVLRSESAFPQAISDDSVSLALPDEAKNDYPTLSAEDKYSVLQYYGIVSPTSGYQGKTEKNEPIILTSGLTIAGATLMALPIQDLFINTLPIVGTARMWDKMGVVGKSVSIALDIFSIVPLVGQIGAGARSVSEVGRMARFMGGVKGLGSGIWHEAIAPVEIILHPVQTAKSAFVGLRELVELGNIRKLPQAVITTTEGTIRLPVKMTTSEEEAKQIRNLLADLYRKGEKPVIEIDGARYELSVSPLMKEVGGGLTHATPIGEEFISGTKIAEKIGKPVKEQGLFLSTEPLPRFVKQSAFGAVGEKPSIIIFPPEIAKNAIATDKIYASRYGKVAEIEMKFPVDYVIPEPKQRLFTRIGSEGTRVELLFYEPLTEMQIAKLKSLALIEDLKAPFKPSLLVSGIDEIDTIDDLVDAERIASELRIAGNDNVARTFMDAFRARIVLASDIRNPIVDTVELRTREVNGERVASDYLEVRASGEPQDAIRNVPRTDNPMIFRRLGIPSPTEVRIPETRMPDVRTPEVRIAETRIAEVRVPETRIPAVRVPETRIPEIRTPEVRMTETRIPEPRVPEIRVPETRIPESRIPRLQIPDIRIPETRIPDTRIPQTPEQEANYKEQSSKILPGTLTWVQGKPYGGYMWKLLPPPYKTETMFTMRRAPPGVYKFPTGGKGMARATLQVIGGKPPNDADVDLGWAKVQIRTKGGKLSVDFVHDEDANVGKREETIGYGEGQIPVETARNAKEAGVSGSELIKRVRQGQDISEFEHIEERIPRSSKTKELPPRGLQKIELPQYSRGKLKVYSVSGEYIRDNFDINYTMGGHGHVYDYIPKNEVWIERGGEPMEDKFTLLHELVEREQMAKGMDYEEAHENYANVAEMKARDNPRLLNDMIAEQLGRIPQRKHRVESYEPIDELDAEVEKVLREKKREPITIGSGGTRYYLGHPIRPPELGGSL